MKNIKYILNFRHKIKIRFDAALRHIWSLQKLYGFIQNIFIKFINILNSLLLPLLLPLLIILSMFFSISFIFAQPAPTTGGTTASSPPPSSTDPEKYEWMNSSIDGLGSMFGNCLQPPGNTSFHKGSIALNVANSGEWVSTGSLVKKDKMIKFEWTTLGLETRPRKYLVLYRIDPRFKKPQIFIQTYDYNLGKYVSDFHQYKSGQLVKYQPKPEMTWQQRITDYDNYFNFVNRPSIPIYKGDVINITLIEAGTFFNLSNEFQYELDSARSEASIMYTVSPGKDNQIVYAAAATWCDGLARSTVVSSLICNLGKYRGSDFNSLLVGKPYETKFLDILSTIPICASGSNTRDLPALCAYDKGRGMKILVNGTPVKLEVDSFLHSDFTNKNFLYYNSDSAGSLELTTDWVIEGMFNSFDSLMINWNSYKDFDEFNKETHKPLKDLSANFLHFGRYIMEIEIGNGGQGISFEQQDAIKVEYTISEAQPDKTFLGTEVNKDFRIDAPENGYLWVRAINPNSDVQGAITVNYAHYVGSTWFSDVVYNKLISPIKDKFNQLTKLFYTKLSTDPVLQRIGMLMLTLYVIIYGILFLIGSTKITAEDFIIRITKIAIIVTLFSENSWYFFNDYLFKIYVEGTDYLMSNVAEATSSTTNIFGFVDPVIEKYTNPRTWGLLFIQLLQIPSGVTFFAIMTIYSILIFFRAVIEVIIGYSLAFVGLAVMIGLAPLFLTLMLFEQTKSIFDNWLSTLFDYMISPTILLIFFLLIDQLIGQQLASAVTQACWGCLIPLEIGLDLRHMGIPLDFSFKLPFLPCIPFYITSIHDPTDVSEAVSYNGSMLILVTSSLLFYAYCLMARGLVEYVSVVTSMLTNVAPKKSEANPNQQQQQSGTQSVMKDLKSVTTDPAKSVGRVFKDKVIDQNYQAGENKYKKSENYSGLISKGSRHDMGSDGSGKGGK